jgi:hypothetical protein
MFHVKHRAPGPEKRFCKTTPCIKKSPLFIKDMTLRTFGTSESPERPFSSGLRAPAGGERRAAREAAEGVEAARLRVGKASVPLRRIV